MHRLLLCAFITFSFSFSSYTEQETDRTKKFINYYLGLRENYETSFSNNNWAGYEIRGYIINEITILKLLGNIKEEETHNITNEVFGIHTVSNLGLPAMYKRPDVIKAFHKAWKLSKEKGIEIVDIVDLRHQTYLSKDNNLNEAILLRWSEFEKEEDQKKILALEALLEKKYREGVEAGKEEFKQTCVNFLTVPRKNSTSSRNSTEGSEREEGENYELSPPQSLEKKRSKTPERKPSVSQTYLPQTS